MFNIVEKLEFMKVRMVTVFYKSVGIKVGHNKTCFYENLY
jgi:hypothetical protein